MEYKVIFGSKFEGFFLATFFSFWKQIVRDIFYVFVFCLLLPQKKNKCIRGNLSPSDEIMKTSGMCKPSSGLLECA